MPSNAVYTLEDEGPGHVGYAAYNLAVHEVSQPDEAGSGARGNGNIVEHAPQADARLPHIQPECYHETQRSAVRSQTFVARKLPSALGKKVDGQQHLNKTAAGSEEIVGLIEDAMAQTRTGQDADKAIEEERIELLVADVLLLIQPFHYKIGDGQTEKPAQGVPAES